MAKTQIVATSPSNNYWSLSYDEIGGNLWGDKNDYNDPKIAEFTTNGSVVSSFQTTSEVLAVAVDSVGSIWYSREPEEKVLKADQGGSITTSFRPSEVSSSSPHIIDVDPDSGDVWVVGDGGGDGSSDVGRYTTDGSLIESANWVATKRDATLESGGVWWSSDGSGDVKKVVDDGGAFGGVYTACVVGGGRPVAVDGDGSLWVTNLDVPPSLFKISPKTGVGSPTGATTDAESGNTAIKSVAHAGDVSMSAKIRGAITEFSARAYGSKPTAAIVPPVAVDGDAAVAAAASKPSATASPSSPDGYASVPLIGGIPIENVTEEVVRRTELELGFRANESDMDTLRPIARGTGRFNIIESSDGSFETIDLTDGDATFRYTPKYDEAGFISAQDVVVSEYEENSTSVDFDEYDVTTVFKFEESPDPDDADIDDQTDATDWEFETYAGTIATPRVSANTDVGAFGDEVGYVLRLTLSKDQASALRNVLGRQGAVSGGSGEGSTPSIDDNSPDKSNSFNIIPRDTNQVERGHYIVRSMEFRRRDDLATWYDVELEIAPKTSPIASTEDVAVSMSPITPNVLADESVAAAGRPSVSATGTLGVGNIVALVDASRPTVTATSRAVTGEAGATTAATRGAMTTTVTPGGVTTSATPVAISPTAGITARAASVFGESVAEALRATVDASVSPATADTLGSTVADRPTATGTPVTGLGSSTKLAQAFAAAMDATPAQAIGLPTTLGTGLKPAGVVTAIAAQAFAEALADSTRPTATGTPVSGGVEALSSVIASRPTAQATSRTGGTPLVWSSASAPTMNASAAGATASTSGGASTGDITASFEHNYRENFDFTPSGTFWNIETNPSGAACLIEYPSTGGATQIVSAQPAPSGWSNQPPVGVDGQGCIWGGLDSPSLVKYDRNGSLNSCLADGGYDLEAATTHDSSLIAVNPSGKAPDEAIKMNQAGSVGQSWTTGASTINAIDWGPSFVVVAEGTTLKEFTSTGSLIKSFTLNVSNIHDVAFDLSHSIWISDGGTDTYYRVKP